MAPPRPSQVGKSATALALLLCALISHAGDNKQEFDEWRWAKLSELLDLIVPFKRSVYAELLKDFEHLGN